MIEDAAGLLYMKVGTHAQEELSDIIARKKREIEDAGFAMWGYGGNTCHPSTMVQPFARSLAASGRPILLCMQPMTSRHFAEQVRAREFSTDGLHWDKVPEGINVLGSRYALCVTNLIEVEDELDLGRTRVALGNSKGRPGDQYIKGRVDKACLELVDVDAETPSSVQIELVAEIVDPFAVFLRS
jgi:hypothetical protein